MVWYVALVAILNLGLGYALAVYLGPGQKQRSSASNDIDSLVETLSPIDITANAASAEQASGLSGLESVGHSPIAESPASAVDNLDSVDTDPVTGLPTRDYIAQQLTDMTLPHANRQPMTVALVEVDKLQTDIAGVEDRLLRGIADTVRDILSEAQTAGRFTEEQFLLLLPLDDLQHATQRAEQVRQRIAATHFLADGQEIPTTITCALAQVSADHTADSLLEFLQETLEEAKRYGGNRTFMHDGKTPTPVVPPELNIAPQTCAI